jgi:hypothetical protein
MPERMGDELHVHGLIGVYPDEAAADGVRDALTDAGVPAEAVRVEDRADVETSLKAEMHDELENALVSPQVGVAYPKETVKSSLVLGPIFVIVGGLIAFPFAFIPIGGASFWVRCFWVVLCGMAAGGAAAAVAIPALSVKTTGHEPSAAQQGTVMRVDRWSEQIESTMAAGRPIRLDRIGGGGYPLGTVTTDEDQQPGGAVEQTLSNIQRELHADPQRRER